MPSPCPEKRREQARRWRALNRDKIRENAKAWRAKQPPSYYLKEKKQRDAWRKKNPDFWRKYWVKNQYGLTEAQYTAILEKQDNKCAICRIPFDKTPSRRPCVDHCHETNIVRGVLCHKCNSAIGLLDEDVPTIRRLLSYVRYRC